jgi:uncharacterized repeat protein (TIGR01451 family)
MRRAFFAAVFGICAVQAALAVPVFINSGDPAFPFPQFLPYAHPNGDTLHNLATRAPAGVTHAEMEKAVRDAYAIMMNRAQYEGTVALRGTRYIYFESNPFCSEGTGYALLAAAMMADKTTFDGLWLYTHDYAMNNVVRYIDGRNSPAYSYSTLPGWRNDAGGNSAADGDFDIALALMIAHAQWGELMGINDSRGRAISYKADFIQVLKGLSDTLTYKASGNLLSGDIGLDGYFKGGDSWAELSGWAANAQNLASIGVNNRRVEQAGPTQQHIDYTAPAYFRQFADYLKQENARTYAWNISQFERAEASSDWLFGKLIAQNQRNIPVAGWVELRNDTTPVFTMFSDGEDFRAAWRTILSYVWHGNPKDSWDPVRRTVIRDRTNTYQRDAGLRLSRFLWDRRQSPWNGNCEEIIGEGKWWGPSMLKYHYSPQGEAQVVYPLNWLQGTGSPSAVTAQDTNLMAEMYRQCELEWDVDTPGDRYLTSKPFYFHGFFRLLGMNVLTGNHHAPMNMKRGANMKVYLDVDKTYAFENDTISYAIDYRNYGAEAASGVVITNRLHNDMVYVSSTNGGSYDAASNSVRWNIGAVPGFKTSTGVNPTKGTVSFKVIIPYANLKRYENRAQITCTNGSGWVSNEYPNRISSVMKRSGVDIARRALRVNHSVYRDTVNPGMNAVYTINFENSAEAGWLNGGRPGVNFSYAHNGTPANSGSHTFMLRAFNDAHEAYIDYGNYRISYFLFDNNYTGLGTSGWNVRTDILYVPEAEQSKFKLLHENITPGEDVKGKWNQRLILQIADVLDPSRTDTNWGTMAAPTQFLINYSGLDQRVHRGISTPFKGVWAVYGGNYANRSWGGDWSYNSRASGKIDDDAMASWGYPVSPDFTEDYDPDYKGKPVASLHRKLCGTAPSTVIDNVLIEEWDGYTWRRVFGNGPVPGREVNNVVIRDTLPKGVTFQKFLEPYPFGVAPKISGGIITWEIDKLLVGQGGRIQYSVRAETPASFPNVTSARVTSRAWASADRESPMSATAILVVTSDSLPPPPPDPTTMYKSADKGTYLPGDTINYTIAYRQTHGYPIKSASRDEWAGSNINVNGRGDTISFNDVTNMYHKLSYGTNGTLSGTAISAPSQDFHIFARSDVNGNNRVDVMFRQEWDGIHVTITSTGQTPVEIPSPFGSDNGVFDYKMVFRRDSLLLWIRDTSAAIPSFVQTGVPVRAGYAGVRYTTAGYGDARLVNWSSHFDLAYNVVIRDTVPFGVKYIDGSAAGRINTGTLSPKELSGVFENNVVVWRVVSGLNIPGDALGANDSITVTWKGVVDTAKNGTVVNTAYADIASYPKDFIGAQLRSKFALSMEPPDTGGGGVDTNSIEPPPPIPGVLAVWADRPDCIFTDTLTVTLSSIPSGAVIYYTRNGMSPDIPSAGRFTYVDGQPVKIYADPGNPVDYILKVIAYDMTDRGDDPSDVITRVYVPLRTVPVTSAIFYDDVGDGLAHGIKLALNAARAAELNLDVVKKHLDLIAFPDMPELDSDLTRVGGDTLVIPFKRGVNPASGAKLTIRKPVLPGPSYTSAHGYLADTVIAVIDGIAPVIVRAEYRLASSEGYLAGDTLVVWFNKHAEVADRTGEIAPFTLSYGQGVYKYELLLTYDGRGDNNSVYFLVVGILGDSDRQEGDLVQKGDSIRINAASGQISNFDSRFTQKNERNNAVPLDVREPKFDYEYEVKVGPNPFRGNRSDSLRIWVSMKQRFERAFEALGSNVDVRIFDGMGKIVALTGENLIVRPDPQNRERYLLVWRGANRKGRSASTGVYLVKVVLTDPNGNKHTFRQKVYLLSR